MIPPEDSKDFSVRWMRIARGHDIGLYRHSLLVGRLTAAFTHHLGLSPADQLQVVQASLLHDIGKTKISRTLLRKPGLLTEVEISQMRLHPETGYRMLLAEGGHSSESLNVVREHHERLDGSGYPHGLLAPAISEPVRIVTLCDIYAAMTEMRPYATPFSREDALSRMEMKKTRLDLCLLRQFSTMLRNFVYVYPTSGMLNIDALLEEKP